MRPKVVTIILDYMKAFKDFAFEDFISEVKSPETEFDVTTEATGHTAWLQSMAKYRRLEPIDVKQELLDSLDERFK